MKSLSSLAYAVLACFAVAVVPAPKAEAHGVYRAYGHGQLISGGLSSQVLTTVIVRQRAIAHHAPHHRYRGHGYVPGHGPLWYHHPRLLREPLPVLQSPNDPVSGLFRRPSSSPFAVHPVVRQAPH